MFGTIKRRQHIPHAGVSTCRTTTDVLALYRGAQDVLEKYKHFIMHNLRVHQDYQQSKPHIPPVPSTTVYGIAALPPQTPCHDRPEHRGQLLDCNFITRLLYKNIY